MTEQIALDPGWLVYYGIDFVIAIALLAGVRILSGLVANVSSGEELAARDNPAFGLSIAGAAVAVAIMLMGVVVGDIAYSPVEELLLVGVYGLLGVVLMWLTRKLLDHVALPHLSLHEEIMKGNIAAGMIDAGNMIATAIMIRAIMVWIDGASLASLDVVLVGYVLSQVLLILASRYRDMVFEKRHSGDSLHQEIEAGNTALALRFVGYRIGIALAVTAASGIAIYSPEHIVTATLIWAGVALVMFFVLTGVAILMRLAVLHGIDVAEEVDKQKNVAIGAIEAAIYLAVGFLLAGLFG